MRFQLGQGDYLPYRLTPRHRFPPPPESQKEEGEMDAGISAIHVAYSVPGPQVFHVGFRRIATTSGSRDAWILSIALGLTTPFEPKELKFARRNFAKWEPVGNLWIIPIQSVGMRSALGEIMAHLDTLAFEPFVLNGDLEIYWNFDVPEKAIATVRKMVEALDNFWDLEGSFLPKQLVVPRLSDEEIDDRLRQLFAESVVPRRPITNGMRVACLRHQFSNYEALLVAAPKDQDHGRIKAKVMNAIRREYPRLFN